MAASESRRFRREHKRLMKKKEDQFKKDFIKASKEKEEEVYIPKGEKLIQQIEDTCKDYIKKNYSKYETGIKHDI